MYNEEGGSTFYIPRHTSLVRLSYYNKQEGQIEEEEEEEGEKQKEGGVRKTKRWWMMNMYMLEAKDQNRKKIWGYQLRETVPPKKNDHIPPHTTTICNKIIKIVCSRSIQTFHQLFKLDTIRPERSLVRMVLVTS